MKTNGRQSKEAAWAKFAEEIVKAIDTRQGAKPKAYDTQAEVVRVKDGTAWVHIPGGVAETPVRETIACRKGDTVQVRVADGRATITGNSSAPPTDDKTARAAQEAADDAMAAAEAAQETADGTSQFFWYRNGEGDEAGAHVTEVSRETFEKNPQGGNILIRSNVLRLRMALATLAELAAAGLKIYEPGDSTNPIAQFLGTAAVIGKETGYNVRTAAQQLQFWNNGTLLGYITGAAPAPGLHLMDEGEDASYFTPGSIRLMEIQNHMSQGRTDLMAPVEDGDNILWAADGNDTELLDIYYDEPNNKAHMDLTGTLTADKVHASDFGSVSATAVGTSGNIAAAGKLTGGNLDAGSDTAATAASGSTTTKAVSFNKTFTAAPKVVIGFTYDNSATGTTNSFGNCAISAVNITTTGFTAKFYNGSGTQKTPTFDWIALLP